MQRQSTVLFLMVGVTAFAVSGLLHAAPADTVAFDGRTQSVRVEAASRFTTPAFSVAAWVKVDSLRVPQVFVNRGERGKLFTLYLYKDGVRMLVEYAGGEYASATVPAPKPAEWHHYLGTYDGKQIVLYVDGRRAAVREAEGRMPSTDDPVFIGARAEARDVLGGAMADVRVYGAALAGEQVAAVYRGEEPDAARLLVRLSADELRDQMRSHEPETDSDNYPTYMDGGELPVADGFRGIWYANQASGDEYKFKYSGGLATYPQQHHPIAVHSSEANKTFFVYGGRYKTRNQLLHTISYYDHATRTVGRPRVLLDKQTNDAHDNPVLSIDAGGYLYVFSNSHGTGRPSYIHRSVKPYDITAFKRIWTGNFSYGQPWHLPDHGFVFLHTRYKGGRALHVMQSADGAKWTEPTLLAKIAQGHYQVSWPRGNVIGTAFNYHPKSSGLNWRTNIYYMQTTDGGKTWRNAKGERIALPLTVPENNALALEYESKKRLCYLKDIQFTPDGRPVVLYLTSKGYQSGPANDPREFTTAEWTGEDWRTAVITRGDNNYDFGSLYVESATTWRLIGTTAPGPQRYNTGGEMAMWLSEDAGRTWRESRRMTTGSTVNHTYPRRPLNAHPDFYALWADGHGRQPSESHLYFCNRAGDIFRLPPVIAGSDPQVDVQAVK